MVEGDRFMGGGFSGRDLVEKEGEELHVRKVEMVELKDPIGTDQDKGGEKDRVIGDDIVYTGSCPQMLEEFKSDMIKHYEMTNLGLVNHLLEVGVLQTEGNIFIHQKKYAMKLIEKFGLKDCKIVATPLVVIEKLSRVDSSEATDEEEYIKLVRSLLYLTTTRPNIMFAASLLARFMHNPTKKQIGTTKRVDSARSEDDMRSTSGYAFTLRSEVFSWASIKQSTMALSTVETKYERVSNVAYNIVNGICKPVQDQYAPVYITFGDGGNLEGLTISMLDVLVFMLV
ncbi:hypothetical protein D8674_026086 [Pyrus ussuriensis x Pyrus communis]|uniref:Reverse transcriptase Ty1/copia-type domain-containing protein n=1 Tax=Pyrus ussuriensis x Pyrus communis TaxID=2448454 RepID=A0A5N5IAR1_9ROSA|nr:hypothetical protein D8674_026086 [Pyrus ussuriensis x Pyrus communis]